MPKHVIEEIRNTTQELIVILWILCIGVAIIIKSGELIAFYHKSNRLQISLIFFKKLYGFLRILAHKE